MSKYDFGYDIKENRTNLWAYEKVRENSRVLELGSAGGTLTKSLYEKKNCRVDIVELNEADGRLASQFAETAVIGSKGNLNQDDWFEAFAENRYDYIVALDVLEHLSNPEQTLKKAKRLLKEDGKILLSIPNLAHNAVIIELLQNQFAYGQLGLLDNTHVHFFAYESILTMVRNVGLHIDKQEAVLKCVSDTELPSRYEDLEDEQRHLLENRKYGEVYQYLLELSLHMERETVNLLGDGQTEKAIYARLLPDGELQNEISAKIQEGFNEFVTELPPDLSMESVRVVPYEGFGIVADLQVFGKTENDWEKLPYNWTSAQQLSDGVFFVRADEHQNEMNYPLIKEYSALKIRYRLISLWGKEKRLVSLFLRGVKEFDHRIETLQNQVSEAARQLEETKARSEENVTQKNSEIEALHRDAAEKDSEIAELHQKVEEKMAETETLHQEIEKKNSEIGVLHRDTEEKNLRIKELSQNVAEKNLEIEDLKQCKTVLDEKLRILHSLIREIRSGKIWKIFALFKECGK